MSDEVGLTRGQYVAMLVVVTTVAGIVAAFLGSLAGLLYGGWYLGSSIRPPYTEFGMYWGALTGIIAAIFWCRLMDRHIRDKGDNRSVLVGTLAGIMAGVISTTLLHAGLIVASQKAEWQTVLFCEACGVVAGLVVGFIAAAGVHSVVRKNESLLLGASVETESNHVGADITG